MTRYCSTRLGRTRRGPFVTKRSMNRRATALTEIMLVDRPYHDAYRDGVPPSGWTFACLVAILALIFGGETFAQDSELRTYGDPSVRTAADAQLKRVYELVTGPGVHIELLTRDNPLQLRNAVGIEVSAAIIDGSAGRIVGTVWTKRGSIRSSFIVLAISCLWL